VSCQPCLDRPCFRVPVEVVSCSPEGHAGVGAVHYLCRSGLAQALRPVCATQIRFGCSKETCAWCLRRPLKSPRMCLRATAPRSIKEDRPAEMRYEISAAILEIYNEAVVDLLAPGGKAELELARSGGGFDLPDLTCVGALPYPSAACQPRASSCAGSSSRPRPARPEARPCAAWPPRCTAAVRVVAAAQASAVPARSWPTELAGARAQAWSRRSRSRASWRAASSSARSAATTSTRTPAARTACSSCAWPPPTPPRARRSRDPITRPVSFAPSMTQTCTACSRLAPLRCAPRSSKRSCTTAQQPGKGLLRPRGRTGLVVILVRWSAGG